MNDFYIDAGAGVAGDMLLGAWIGLGISKAELESMLKRTLRVPGWRLIVKEEERKSWPARTVSVEGDRPFGGAAKMRATIRRSALAAPVKESALRMIDALAWAE